MTQCGNAAAGRGLYTFYCLRCRGSTAQICSRKSALFHPDTYTRTGRSCGARPQIISTLRMQDLPVLLPPETRRPGGRRLLSSVSGSKRYNTLDLASKVVCQQGAARPYWKPRAKEGSALFGISHGFRLGSEGTPYPLPWQPKPAQEGRPPLENFPAGGLLNAVRIQSPPARQGGSASPSSPPARGLGPFGNLNELYNSAL